MTIGRPMPPLILDDEERETLERWVRRPKTAQALALRARMVLGCAEGRSNTVVGAELEGLHQSVQDKPAVYEESNDAGPWRERAGFWHNETVADEQRHWPSTTNEMVDLSH